MSFLRAQHTVDMQVVRSICQERNNIVVIAGAGMSTSAGIPDFSTCKSGLQRKDFHISAYDNNVSTLSFHQMLCQLHETTAIAKPTPCHEFLHMLALRGRLRRLYTQNIDGLEKKLGEAGGLESRTIRLHGCIDESRCTQCGLIFPFDQAMFQNAEPDLCGSCPPPKPSGRVLRQRRYTAGRIRPNILLYGDDSIANEETISNAITEDLRNVDLVLVLGTSLQIPGAIKLVKVFQHRANANLEKRNDNHSPSTFWINRLNPSRRCIVAQRAGIVIAECDHLAGINEH